MVAAIETMVDKGEATTTPGLVEGTPRVVMIGSLVPISKPLTILIGALGEATTEVNMN